jgi:hypothetical protein
MTQFEKDFDYVKQKYNQVITPDDLSEAKRNRRFFVDKYVVLVSQTDKRFIEIQNEITELDALITRKISSAYLF